MRHLCKTRNGAALTVGGLLVAACLLSVAGLLSRPAEAQAPPTLPRPTEPPQDPLPPPLAEPPLAPPSTRGSPQSLRGLGIDQLVDHLKTLRAQRAELEKQEKEAVALLREKLKEQRQRLQQLGIPLEEPAAAPPQADPVPSFRPSSPE